MSCASCACGSNGSGAHAEHVVLDVLFAVDCPIHRRRPVVRVVDAAVDERSAAARCEGVGHQARDE
eukprot:4747329-Alexandrium_andersonii.AAC.1